MVDKNRVLSSDMLHATVAADVLSPAHTREHEACIPSMHLVSHRAVGHSWTCFNPIHHLPMQAYKSFLDISTPAESEMHRRRAADIVLRCRKQHCRYRCRCFAHPVDHQAPAPTKAAHRRYRVDQPWPRSLHRWWLSNILCMVRHDQHV